MSRRGCVKIAEKVWGEEYWIVNNDQYCGKKLILHRGYRCSMHHHKNKNETFYLEQGRVFLEYGDPVHPDKVVLHPGDCFEVPTGMWHRFTGVFSFDSVLFEFSTHHEDDDSYRFEGMESGPASEEVMREYARFDVGGEVSTS